MGFSSVKEYAETRSDTGQTHMSFFFKTGSPVSPATGWWSDLSMSAGTPKYNAWLGAQGEGTPMYGIGNSGIYAGQNVEQLGQTKHINRTLLMTNSATFAPAIFLLLDYLYFYPLIDMDSTDLQELNNSAAVPRYSDGRGVMAMIVATVPQTANAVCTMTYTNQAGVSGRTTTFNVRGPSNVGNLNCSKSTSPNGANPFVPLAQGDYGIRSVDSVQMSGSAGGFVSVVLVQTICTTLIRERNTCVEQFFLKHKPSLPRVMDGAYLNFIFSCGVAAISSPIRGEIEFYWG